MPTWNVETFFRRFEQGTMGRKSQYSTYWVNSFDGCKILCNKSAGSHSRDGEQVYGVYMGPDLCVFNRGMVQGSYLPQFSMDFPGYNDITESGVIDSEVTAGNSSVRSVLFQLGHSQYLLEPWWAFVAPMEYGFVQSAPYNSDIDLMLGAAPGAMYGCTHRANNRGVIKRLSEGHKFTTVKDARASLIPLRVIENPDNSFQYKNWWFAPADDYKPRDLTDKEKEILENPPMPWHFGLTTQVVSPILVNGSAMEQAINLQGVRSSLNKDVLFALTQYVDKKKIYGEVIARLHGLYFDQDEGDDFNSFVFLPGQSMSLVQKEQDGLYYVMGDMHSKADGHFALRYNGMEKAYKLAIAKKLVGWHAMIKEFERV